MTHYRIVEHLGSRGISYSIEIRGRFRWYEPGAWCGGGLGWWPTVEAAEQHARFYIKGKEHEKNPPIVAEGSV